MTTTTTALDKLKLDYKKGNGYLQLSCPWAKTRHKKGTDNNPSFVIYDDRDLAKCYSCGYTSGIFEFLASFADYSDSPIDFEYLEFHFEDIKEDEEDLENVILNSSILSGMSRNQSKLTEYLLGREHAIDPEYLDYELYHDIQNNTLVFPVRDVYNNLIGATGRRMSGIGHHHYFGLLTTKCLAGFEKNSANRILIVEGLTDLLNVRTIILRNGLDLDVYATLTCSLSDFQADLLVLDGRPVFMGWDMDDAGRKGRKKALPKLAEISCLVNLSWRNSHIDMGNMPDEQFIRLIK